MIGKTLVDKSCVIRLHTALLPDFLPVVSEPLEVLFPVKGYGQLAG